MPIPIIAAAVGTVGHAIKKAWPTIKNAVTHYGAMASLMVRMKSQDMQNRKLSVAAGVLGVDDGQEVARDVEEFLSGKVRLDEKRLPGFANAFGDLRQTCDLIKLEPDLGPQYRALNWWNGDEQPTGYKVVQLRNPVSEYRSQGEDCLGFRHHVVESIDEYYKTHQDMSKAKAYVIALDNYIQLFLGMLDQAKKIPGKDGQEAITALQTQLNTLMENFSTEIATKRTIGVFNHVFKTGRGKLIDNIKEDVGSLFDAARKEHRTRSLPEYSDDLMKESKTTFHKMQDFVAKHSSLEESKRKAIIKHWQEHTRELAKGDVEHVSEDYRRIKLRQGADPSDKEAVGVDSALLASALSVVVGEEMHQLGVDQGRSAMRTSAGMLSVQMAIIMALENYSVKQLQLVVPEAGQSAGETNRFENFGVEKRLAEPVDDAVRAVDESLGRTQKLVSVVGELIPENPVMSAPSPTELANIAAVCALDTNVAASLTEALSKSTNSAVQAASQILQSQISAFQAVRSLSWAAAKFSYPKDSTHELVRKGILVQSGRVVTSAKINPNNIRTQDDFNVLLEFLQEQKKAENNTLIEQLTLARNRIFVSPVMVSEDREAATLVTASNPEVAGSVAGKIAEAERGEGSAVEVHQSPDVELRWSAISAEAVKIMGDYSAGELDIHRHTTRQLKKHGYFYDCGDIPAKPASGSAIESLLSQQVILRETDKKGARINLGKLTTYDQFTTLIRYLEDVRQTRQEKATTKEPYKVPEADHDLIVRLEADRDKLFPKVVDSAEQSRVLSLMQKVDDRLQVPSNGGTLVLTADQKKLFDQLSKVVARPVKHDAFGDIVASCKDAFMRSGGQLLNAILYDKNVDSTNEVFLDLFSKSIISINGSSVQVDMSGVATREDLFILRSFLVHKYKVNDLDSRTIDQRVEVLFRERFTVKDAFMQTRMLNITRIDDDIKKNYSDRSSQVNAQIELEKVKIRKEVISGLGLQYRQWESIDKLRPPKYPLSSKLLESYLEAKETFIRVKDLVEMVDISQKQMVDGLRAQCEDYKSMLLPVVMTFAAYDPSLAKEAQEFQLSLRNASFKLDQCQGRLAAISRANTALEKVGELDREKSFLELFQDVGLMLKEMTELASLDLPQSYQTKIRDNQQGLQDLIGSDKCITACAAIEKEVRGFISSAKEACHSDIQYECFNYARETFNKFDELVEFVRVNMPSQADILIGQRKALFDDLIKASKDFFELQINGLSQLDQFLRIDGYSALDKAEIKVGKINVLESQIKLLLPLVHQVSLLKQLESERGELERQCIVEVEAMKPERYVEDGEYDLVTSPDLGGMQGGQESKDVLSECLQRVERMKRVFGQTEGVVSLQVKVERLKGEKSAAEDFATLKVKVANVLSVAIEPKNRNAFNFFGRAGGSRSKATALNDLLKEVNGKEGKDQYKDALKTFFKKALEHRNPGYDKWRAVHQSNPKDKEAFEKTATERSIEQEINKIPGDNKAKIYLQSILTEVRDEINAEAATVSSTVEAGAK